MPAATSMSAALSEGRLPAPSSAVRPHPVHWNYVLPIATVHVLACLAFVPALFSWSGLALALICTHLFGMLGINICYHRLLTHRSLAVPLWLEHWLATIAVCSLEDTPVRWVATHRLHHVHSDEPADPHSPNDGIGWAHAGWLFRTAPDRRTLAFFDRYARDILTDRYYRRLEKRPASVLWIYLAHLLVFGAAGWLVGFGLTGRTAAAAQLAASWVVWGGLVRTVLVWHQTWSVNSLSHLFGYRNYETGENSRNNWLVALLAAGEGWHNNHHHDPVSASVQHRWWEFDITYYAICLLARLGLARDIVLPRHVRQARPAAGPRS
jgi:stearoyl-CoA desaturase (delta-9 desaturase)